MPSSPFLIVLLTLSGAYLVLVSYAVAGRIHRDTGKLLIGFIFLIGFIGMWAILRVATGHWQAGTGSMIHALFVVAGAATLAVCPRIRT